MKSRYILFFVLIACIAAAATSTARVQTTGSDAAAGRMITLDGEPFFPIGVYSVRIEDMQEVAAAGFNLVHNYRQCCDEADLNFHGEFLSAADKHGLKVFLYPFYPHTRLEEGPEQAARLADAIRKRAAHPSLLFWYTFDEPDLFNKATPAECSRVDDFLRETDPAHPTAVVIATQVRYPDYIGAADWFMVDPYPIPFVSISLVRDSVRNAVAAARGDKPVIAVIQAHDQTPYFNMKVKNAAPSEREIRNMAYQAIVNGAGGIIFWALHASKYDLMAVEKQWTALKNVAADLKNHYEIFIMPDSEIKIVPQPADAPVDILIKEAPDGYRLLAVNYTKKQVAVTLGLSPLNPATVTELDTAQTPSIRNNLLALELAPLAVRMFEIIKEPNN